MCQRQKSDNTPRRYLVVSLSPAVTPCKSAFLSIYFAFLFCRRSNRFSWTLGFSLVNKLGVDRWLKRRLSWTGPAPHLAKAVTHFHPAAATKTQSRVFRAAIVCCKQLFPPLTPPLRNSLASLCLQMSSSNNLKCGWLKSGKKRIERQTVWLRGGNPGNWSTSLVKTQETKKKKKNPCEFPRKLHPDNSLIPHPIQSPFTQAFHLHKQGRRVGQKTFDQVRVNLSTVWTRRALLRRDSTSEGLWERGVELPQCRGSAPTPPLSYCSIFCLTFFLSLFFLNIKHSSNGMRLPAPEGVVAQLAPPPVSLRSLPEKFPYADAVLAGTLPLLLPHSFPAEHVWAPSFFILQISCQNISRPVNFFFFFSGKQDGLVFIPTDLKLCPVSLDQTSQNSDPVPILMYSKKKQKKKHIFEVWMICCKDVNMFVSWLQRILCKAVHWHYKFTSRTTADMKLCWPLPC